MGQRYAAVGTACELWRAGVCSHGSWQRAFLAHPCISTYVSAPASAFVPAEPFVGPFACMAGPCSASFVLQGQSACCVPPAHVTATPLPAAQLVQCIYHQMRTTQLDSLSSSTSAPLAVEAGKLHPGKPHHFASTAICKQLQPPGHTVCTATSQCTQGHFFFYTEPEHRCCFESAQPLGHSDTAAI